MDIPSDEGDGTGPADDHPCLCQGKVPKAKRVDVEQRLPVDKSGRKLREGGIPLLNNGRPVTQWFPVVRFHRDCPEHGIKAIKEEPKCRED